MNLTAENSDMSKGIKLSNGLTPDEERFAGLLAEGMTQTDAMTTVWPDTQAWDSVRRVPAPRPVAASCIRQVVGEIDTPIRFGTETEVAEYWANNFEENG